ncbi:MAG: hypothetical protein QGI83_16340 [Candidatus Latescibacteria bacterium]|jgi:hypothetical protein|nr:hypothetical protein [Candidatus Latescibacterota bacterium]
MIYLVVLLGLIVIGVKYYTAVGGRRLERRLNVVRSDLERARQRLREERERQEEIRAEEEVAELRLRYMREIIEDLEHRMTGPLAAEKDIVEEKEEVIPLPSFVRM